MRSINIEGVKKYMFLENRSFRSQYKEEALDTIRREAVRAEAAFKI